VGSRQPHQEVLLVLAFDAAHRGGNKDHPGIRLQALMIDEAHLLVIGLLVLEAELHPRRVFRSAPLRRGTCRGSRRRGRWGGSRPWHRLLRHWLAPSV